MANYYPPRPPAGVYSFKKISTTSGTSPVADSATDTLSLTAGTGITITGDSSTDTVTIASTATGGSSVTVSDTAPSSPSDDDLWYNSTDGGLYIYYNDGTSSQWVQVKSDSVTAASPMVVASSAARDSAFPSPVQGNSVFRSDKGWVETYYALYNSSTNPGGATPAGWYPTAGNMPQAKIVRNTTAFNFTNAAWNTIPNLTYWETEIAGFGGVSIESNGTIKTTLPGQYEVSVGIMSAGISFCITSLKLNSMAADGANQVGVATGRGESGWTGTNVKSTIKMAANDYIFWSYYVNGTSSSYSWNTDTARKGSFLSIRYVGPPLGA